MSAQQMSPQLEETNVRKRVCKACDRCRLKKSKCDGTTPCSRCRSDNAICVFGERKKSHDKVYPKGYVEMLEHQQQQLVNGLQELYKQATQGGGWEGPLLNDNGTGRPLTHDILSRLGVLQQDSQGASFDDDLESMQQRLIRDGADMVSRPDSDSSEDGKSPTRMGSFFETSSMQRVPSTPFADQLPTPPMHSPISQSVSMKMPHAQTQPINFSHVSWDGTSVHPADLTSQNWASSPISYDGQLFSDAYPNYTGIPASHQQMMLPADMAASNTPMPDWTEEDFNAFLNPTLAC